MKSIFLILLLLSIKSFAHPKFPIVQTEKATLSAVGIDLNEQWEKDGLAPLGSAAITESGDLKESGINYIIHAASGSMSSYDNSTEPTLKSIKLSIINSIKLAELNNVKTLAIPLIGGGIFLDRIGTTRELLAYEIITTAMETKTKLNIVFVAYSEEDSQAMNEAYQSAKPTVKIVQLNWLQKLWNYLISFFKKNNPQQKLPYFFEHSRVARGSITKFSDHGGDAIVNAANMELQFGGGLSGIIGKATGQTEEIDQDCAELIKEFWSKNK